MPRYIPLSTFTCTLQYNALKKSFRVFQIGGFQNIEPLLYVINGYFESLILIETIGYHIQV